MSRMDGTAQAFWDRVFARGDADAYSRVAVPTDHDQALEDALLMFGDVTGKRVLDLGCGAGKSSLFFASRGAHVTSVDLSGTAIDNLKRFCAAHEIANVDPRQMSALDIDAIGPFDRIYGSMVLHHLEPFGEFCTVLRRSLAGGGCAFFSENCLSFPPMRWFRNHLVGRFGIPKYGDADESPLCEAEVDQLRGHFQVEVVYPEVLLVRLLSVYLLGRRLNAACSRIDEWLYRVPPLRRLSYRQYLKLTLRTDE